jgi:GNAT superfamily N-acetyltransferase
MTDVNIVNLFDNPQLAPTVATWVHTEWSTFSGRSYDETVERFSVGSDAGGLPVTLVALIGGIPAGVASLRAHDSVDYGLPDASPWICNVYVAPHARGHSVASLLCLKLVDCAAARGFPAIFLATSQEDSLYHRLGFQEVHRAEHHGAKLILQLETIAK